MMDAILHVLEAIKDFVYRILAVLNVNKRVPQSLGAYKQLNPGFGDTIPLQVPSEWGGSFVAKIFPTQGYIKAAIEDGDAYSVLYFNLEVGGGGGVSYLANGNYFSLDINSGNFVQRNKTTDQMTPLMLVGNAIQVNGDRFDCRLFFSSALGATLPRTVAVVLSKGTLSKRTVSKQTFVPGSQQVSFDIPMFAKRVMVEAYDLSIVAPDPTGLQGLGEMGFYGPGANQTMKNSELCLMAQNVTFDSLGTPQEFSAQSRWFNIPDFALSVAFQNMTAPSTTLMIVTFEIEE